MITVKAVYEKGVLRPTTPLPLVEGETVEVLVASRSTNVPSVDVEEAVQRMRGTKTLAELFTAYESLPSPEDGYDLCRALNENRRATSERLLYPEPDRGSGVRDE